MVHPRRRRQRRRRVAAPPILLSALAVLLARNRIGSTTAALSVICPSSSVAHSNAAQRRRGLRMDGDAELISPLVQPARRRRVTSSSSALSIRPGGGEEDSEGSERSDRIRRLGMSAALFTTYLAVMGAKCALPSTLSLLTSPSSGMSFPSSVDLPPQKIMARVLALSTVAISLGKFLLGPVIDALGGAFCLRVALAALSTCLGLIASASSFATFARCWIAVDFMFSACWPACLNAIHGTFPPDRWAGKVGMLAVAARTGNAVAFAAFGSVLSWARGRAERAGATGVGQEWRAVFWASALAQALPLTLLTVFGRGRRRDDSCTSDKTTLRQSLAVLWRESATPLFWLHLISRSALMVYASFLLFVPSLMSHCFGMNSSEAARVGSVYALGCLTSVYLGSDWYARLSLRGKVTANAVQLGLAVACALLLLGHVSGSLLPSSLFGLGGLRLTPAAGTALLFLWGASFAVPFYIPPSLYALRRGGRESSATIADAFDLVGFALLAAFNGYVAGIDQSEPGEWRGTFGLLAGCAGVSLGSLVGAPVLEGREEEEDSKIQ